MRLLNTLFMVMLVGIAGCESREEARRKQVANNLKQLGLALHAYHARHAEPVGEQDLGTSDQVPETAPANAEDTEHQAEKTTKVIDVLPERGP